VTTLDKYPEENRRYTFDFTDQKEIVNGETITSATVAQEAVEAGSGSVTIAAPTISADGKQVSAFISGGVEESKYLLLCLATTNQTSILAICGRLKLLKC
jgi:hypothetical protein